MLAVLGDYLKTLNAEIENYEALIVQKRTEAEKLSQLQGQVVEALGLLREVITELRVVDPSALAVVHKAAFEIFESDNPDRTREITESPSNDSNNHGGSPKPVTGLRPICSISNGSLPVLSLSIFRRLFMVNQIFAQEFPFVLTDSGGVFHVVKV